MRQFLLTLAAILTSFLLLNLPFVSAVQINVLFNGQQIATTEIGLEKQVNKKIEITRDPVDVGWARPKVKIELSSASLTRVIKRIYVFKCVLSDPASCITSQPIVFDTYADVEIAWADISTRIGQGAYPEAANLLILIKLEDGRTGWLGSWDRIVREAVNKFTIYSSDVDRIDINLKSSELADAVAFYIDKYQMIPASWMSSATFYSAGGINKIFAASADSAQMETSNLTSAILSGSTISEINKDFVFAFPNTTSGPANPITFNLNPSFTCGNRLCETELGESPASCCYDCACGPDQYCDVSGPDDTTGTCRSQTAITLTASQRPAAPITDCYQQPIANISATIANAPTSLPNQLTGWINIAGDVQAVSCSKRGPGSYDCPVQLIGLPTCGRGQLTKGPINLSLDLTYNDGPGSVTQTVYDDFQAINIGYDCGCPSGSYCDAAGECRLLDAIRLSVISSTSKLNYPQENTVNIKARVENLPTGGDLTGWTLTIGNITKDSEIISGYSKSLDCSQSGGIWDCSTDITISNYDSSKRYVHRQNSINVTLSFTDRGQRVVQTLTAPLPDIVIPSQACGDGIQQSGESSSNCCLDVPCTGFDQYCDPDASDDQCKNIAEVGLEFVSVKPYPIEFDDCRVQHDINLTVQVKGPADPQVIDAKYVLAGSVKDWPVSCVKQWGGKFKCTITIPPEDGCADEQFRKEGSVYYDLGPNSLNLTIAFKNGTTQLQREIGTTFGNIKINDIWHCGDGIPEEDLGESSDNCCIDVPCKSSDQYCDWHPELNPNGQCKSKSAIKLVLDSVAPVNFDLCETSNEASVKAHIENAPSEISLESYTATINGTAARFVGCIEERVGPGMPQTYNCTIRFERIFNCSSGTTYCWGPGSSCNYNIPKNNLSFFISYQDGKMQRRTQTIWAELPTFTATQNIKSIYQIINNGVAELKSRLDTVISYTNDLLDWYDTCIKLMYAAAMIGVATLIGVGIFGIGAGVTPGGLGWTEAGKMISGAAMGVGGLMTAVSGFCNTIASFKQVMIEMQRVYMERIHMELCLNVIEHMLDLGQCQGAEESCFDKMVSCVNFDRISNALSGVQTAMGHAQSYTKEMTSGFVQMGEAMQRIGDIIEDSRATLIVRVDDRPFSGSGVCITRGKSATGSGCLLKRISLYTIGYRNCGYPVIMDDNTGEEIQIGSGSITLDSEKIANELKDGQSKTYQFQLYCFTDEKDYAAHSGEINKRKVKGASRQLTIWGISDIQNCKCPEQAEVSEKITTTGGSPDICGATPNSYAIVTQTSGLELVDDVGNILCNLPANSQIQIIDATPKTIAELPRLKIKVIEPGTENMEKKCTKDQEGWIVIKIENKCTFEISSATGGTPPADCGLNKGDIAVVVGEEINLRGSPTSTNVAGDVVCKVPKFSTVKIVDGPEVRTIYNKNYNGWRVEIQMLDKPVENCYTGTKGWMTEKIGDKCVLSKFSAKNCYDACAKLNKKAFCMDKDSETCVGAGGKLIPEWTAVTANTQCKNELEKEFQQSLAQAVCCCAESWNQIQYAIPPDTKAVECSASSPFGCGRKPTIVYVRSGQKYDPNIQCIKCYSGTIWSSKSSEQALDSDITWVNVQAFTESGPLQKCVNLIGIDDAVKCLLSSTDYIVVFKGAKPQ
jgi:hypothetical protein